MNSQTPDEVRDLLRNVAFPGLRRDIVSFGFIREVDANGAAVSVTFAPNTTDEGKVHTMEEDIRKTLTDAGYVLVQVRTEPPFDDGSMLLGSGTMNPLQMELLEDGVDAQPDVFQGTPVGAAPAEAQVPSPFDGPSGGPDDAYRGPVPVFQWQVDPADEGAPTAETAVLQGDWEFRVWWQQLLAHELVYASMQAVRDDWALRDGEAREHPVGRTEAVNLVYDVRRKGVVAIYGTVRDFRPFVDAFREAYGLATEEGGHAAAGQRDGAATPPAAPEREVTHE